MKYITELSASREFQVQKNHSQSGDVLIRFDFKLRILRDAITKSFSTVVYAITEDFICGIFCVQFLKTLSKNVKLFIHAGTKQMRVPNT